MLIHSISPLIDYSEAAGVVFRGTQVPIEKLFQVYDRNHAGKSIDDFVRQYPEITPSAAYGVLALAGRYWAFVLQNRLSFSPAGLSDQVWSAATPRTLAAFAVDWQTLIMAAEEVTCDRFRYFEEIAHYGNTPGKMVFGRVFEFSADPEFARLLNHLNRYLVFPEFIATLLSETAIQAELGAFAPTTQALSQQINDAQFQRISPFYMAAELSNYLYHTGIYRRFYQDHTVRDAQEITQDFLQQIFSQKPEDGLLLLTRAAWGGWFDRHSVTDLTIVGINLLARQIWLFTVTDSD